MRMPRRLFIGSVLVVMASGLASADQIQFMATSLAQTTDVINGTLTIDDFDPGHNGIPVGAVLNYYTVSIQETISGMINITNVSGQKFGNGARFGIDTLGAVSIGSPLSGDGQPDAEAGDAANDIFGGSGPDPKETVSVANLAIGASTGDIDYTKFETMTTGEVFDSNASAPPDPLTIYFSTFTNQDSSGLGSNGAGNNYTDSVTIQATITYDYDVPGEAPEPATMALMGGSLLGLGLLCRRFKKRD